MADLKQIRLTYLWADEHVMLKDFSTGVSSKMTNWTREFYHQYGFTVDVDPPFDIRRKGAFRWVSKYALRKDSGVRPDLDLPQKLLQESRKAVPLLERAADLEKRIAADQSELEPKLAARPALEAKVQNRMAASNASLTQANFDAAKQAFDELTALRSQIDALVARINKTKGEANSLVAQAHAIQANRDRMEIEGDYERQLRAQLAEKSSKDRIGSERRLSVVFCDFHPPLDGDDGTDARTFNPIEATMRVPGIPLAGFPAKTWLWPYSFIIVDLKGQRRSIAHELVHASDPSRIHPTAADIAEIVAKRPHPPRTFPSRTGTILGAQTGILSRLEYLDQFETLASGYFDGKANDIMNYTQKDKEPSDYILEEKDRKLIEQGPFVAP